MHICKILQVLARWVEYALDPISIVALDKHNFLRYIFPLPDGAESDFACCARVGFLVPMCDAHTASNGHVESDQFTTSIDNGDEPNVVRKYVHIIRRRNGNSNFELDYSI